MYSPTSAGHFVLAQLAAKRAVESEASAQMHLEAFDVAALAVFDHLAFESDVGDLDPGARVRAAVEVDGDRNIQGGVEVRQSLFEFGNQMLRPVAGFGEGQACSIRSPCRTSGFDANATAATQAVPGRRVRCEASPVCRRERRDDQPDTG